MEPKTKTVQVNDDLVWTVPETEGIWKDLDDQFYHSWGGLSASRSKDLAECPARLKYKLENPMTPTPAMRIGTHFHSLILDGEKQFEDRICVVPKIDRRTTAYQEAVEEFGEENLISRADYDQLHKMRESIFAHSEAKRLLEKLDDREVSAFWTDKFSNCKCKFRGDGIVSIWKTAIDLKTTQAVRSHKFRNSIGEYGYHRQAAHYLDGLNHFDRDFDSFVFIAIEKKPPYMVAVYELDKPSIEAGRRHMADLRKQFVYCLEHNNWPGFPGVSEIQVPQWILTEQGVEL